MNRVVILRMLLAGLLGLTVACAPSRQHLTLLHTSDLHGSVLPWDDMRDQPADGSLARLATLVGQVRSEVAHPVLLLDSGDALQGTPLEQLAHVRWGEPSPTITAMNTMGYAAMALGNHEFNFGLEVLRRAEAQAAFPFLSANTVSTSSGEPAFAPFRVVEAGPVCIGLLGLTTPNIPGWEQPEHFRGLEFGAMDVAARRWVRTLREEEGCDLVVALAHTGFERDPDTGEASDTDVEDYAWRLSQVDGIDVLLTGHTHRDIPPRLLGGTIVSQPSARARALTRIDLELEHHGGAWRVAAWQGRNLSVAEVAPDPSMVERFAALHERLATALDASLTESTAAVSVDGCRLRDCAALDLIHAVQLEASGADLSLASLLTDRTPDLEPGPVTWRWVHALYVYPNTLVAVRLSGVQVKDILEHAARFYDGLDCPSEDRCVLLADPVIPHYNVDAMAGVSYRIDPTRPEGSRLLDLSREGHPLALHDTFTMVVNNYRAAGGGGYPHLEHAEVVWTSSAEVADLIGDHLALLDLWQPSADGSWEVVGAPVAERAAHAR